MSGSYPWNGDLGGVDLESEHRLVMQYRRFSIEQGYLESRSLVYF